MFTVWQNQFGFGPKTMQIHCKPAGLEDQDLKTEPGFGPKIANTCKNTVNQAVWRIKISKLNLGLVPKSYTFKYTVNQAAWTTDPKSEIYKNKFAS